jgi:hypothetical protein
MRNHKLIPTALILIAISGLISFSTIMVHENVYGQAPKSCIGPAYLGYKCPQPVLKHNSGFPIHFATSAVLSNGIYGGYSINVLKYVYNFWFWLAAEWAVLLGVKMTRKKVKI